MSKTLRSTLKRATAALMTSAMVMGIVIGVPGITKDSGTNVNAEVTFKTQVGGVYDGMPLFDGNPEHLDAFVDTLFA